jgi:hypothetical protein
MNLSDPEHPGAPLVDVSDLYDAFHEIALLLLARFEFQGVDPDDPAGEPTFEDVTDQLEVDLFLPACARRLWRQHGIHVDPDAIGSLIRLYDAGGEALHGAAGAFHSHAFIIYAAEDDHVPNEVLSGDLLPRSRQDVRLIVHGGESGGGRRPGAPRRPPLRVI